MERHAKIYVAGSTGLVGSALVRELHSQGYNNVITSKRGGDGEGDFSCTGWTKWFFSVERPEYVFFCAARVGGIADNLANKSEFLIKNLQMELNAISAATQYECKKFLLVGTSCVFPRDCPQPMLEEYLMGGPLEATTEAYSIAKIAGLKLCQYLKEEKKLNAITALPCNIFGPGDNFDEETAHVLPGMMARLHRAKVEGARQFEIWGDGTAKREHIYADDVARGLIVAMEKYEGVGPINVGSDLELSTIQLATFLARAVSFNGQIVSNIHRPTGAPRKLLDSSKLRALGWAPTIPFAEGVRRTYADLVLRRSLERCDG